MVLGIGRKKFCDALGTLQVLRPEGAAPRRERPGPSAGNDKAREEEHVEEGVYFVPDMMLPDEVCGTGREDSLPTPRLLQRRHCHCIESYASEDYDSDDSDDSGPPGLEDEEERERAERAARKKAAAPAQPAKGAA